MTLQAIETEHPLAQTLDRVRKLNEYLKVEFGEPQGEEWLCLPDDVTSGAARLDTLIAATQARLRTKAPNIVGSAMLQSYQWPVISSAVGCYLLDQRVPDIGAANVRLRYNAEGEAEAIAYTRGQFTVLANDPMAQHPDAVVVPDQAALRATLRAAIESHLGGVIAQFCTQLGCKARGLWLNVADSCTGTLIWLMKEHQPAVSVSQIEAEVEALVRVGGSPLNNKQIGLLPLTYRDHTAVFLDRATCCYWYKTEGGDYCSTCPKRTPEDRKELLLKHMADEYAERASA